MGVVVTDDGENGVYLPTPKEIAEQTAMIQATWTDTERNSRITVLHSPVNTDYAHVRQAALAQLETRLTRHEGPVVVDDLSRRGDAVPLEFEPLECF